MIILLIAAIVSIGLGIYEDTMNPGGVIIDTESCVGVSSATTTANTVTAQTSTQNSTSSGASTKAPRAVPSWIEGAAILLAVSHSLLPDDNTVVGYHRRARYRGQQLDEGAPIPKAADENRERKRVWRHPRGRVEGGAGPRTRRSPLLSSSRVLGIASLEPADFR